MGWVSLSLRKQTLKAGIAIDDLRLLQISREKNGVHRELAYQKSIANINKSAELRDIKSVFDEVKKERPNRQDYNFEIGSDKEDYEEAYAEWKEAYDDAKMEYEAQNVDINEYYDNQFSEIEAEAQDKQTTLEDEQTIVETQKAALEAELESVSEQIKTEIQNSAVKFQ